MGLCGTRSGLSRLSIPGIYIRVTTGLDIALSYYNESDWLFARNMCPMIPGDATKCMTSHARRYLISVLNIHMKCFPEQCTSLDCSSHGYRFASCRVAGADAITNVEVVRKYSRSACTYGRSYGPGQGVIWVNRGCRARFRVCFETGKIRINFLVLRVDSIELSWTRCD